MFKKILILFVAPLLVAGGLMYASGTYKTITSSTTFAKAGETDTSATLSLRYYDKVFLQTAIYGTDSIKVLIAVDGLIGSKWDLGIKYDTLFINETSAPDACKATLLRGYGTSSAGGYELIRVRTTLGAVGADDSLSALYYQQYLIFSE